MLTKKFILFLPLVFLLVTCKKEKYPDSVVINEPVYGSEMSVGGRTVKINAGENGYYNYSSFAKDSTGVFVLSSEFAKSDCKTCSEALTFEFYDISKSNLNTVVAIDSVLQVGKRKFTRQGRPAAYTVEFNGSYNRSATENNFVWDFGDGSVGIGFRVEHTYTLEKEYKVCLTAKGENGCSNTICNVVAAPSKGLLSVISHTNNSDTALLKAVISGGKAPYTYFWDFGDGQKSTQTAPTHAYTHTGSYPVTLTVKDASGKTGVFNYNLVSGKDVSSCAANYSISVINSALNGSQNWSKISLKYRAANGNLYSTALIDQKANSHFEILSVSDGGRNENGEKIKKVQIQFTALLSNGIENIEITNGKAIIAVAYN